MRIKLFTLGITLIASSLFADVTMKKIWDGTYKESAKEKKFPGMTIKGNHAQWSFDDDAIRGDMTGGPYTMVWSNDVYADATYEVSYKVDNGNGGMHIRARPDGTKPEDVDDGSDLVSGGTSALGLHVEVDHRDAGCLYGSGIGGWKSHVSGEVAYKSLKGNKSGWINVRVIMKGKNIKTFIKDEGETVWVDGVDYNVGNHTSMQKGRFGLQMHKANSGLFWYRGMRVYEGCSDKTSKYYDKAHIEDSLFVLLDNGSCLASNHSCKDTSYTEYDATKKFGDQSLCKTPNITSTLGRGFENSTLFNLVKEGKNLLVNTHLAVSYSMELLDVSGRILESQKNVESSQVKFSELKEGVYFIKLEANGHYQTEKVVIF